MIYLIDCLRFKGNKQFIRFAKNIKSAVTEEPFATQAILVGRKSNDSQRGYKITLVIVLRVKPLGLLSALVGCSKQQKLL